MGRRERGRFLPLWIVTLSLYNSDTMPQILDSTRTRYGTRASKWREIAKYIFRTIYLDGSYKSVFDFDLPISVTSKEFPTSEVIVKFCVVGGTIPVRQSEVTTTSTD